MSIDLETLTKQYFYFNKPVDYKLKDKNIVNIYPVNVKDSEFFLWSIDILMIDKNASSDPKIIQMSYLQFICDYLITNESYKQKLINLLILCLKIRDPIIERDKLNRPSIYSKEQNLSISFRDFDDIKRIILYQNLIHYDDTYINPDLKKAIEEMEEIKQRQYDFPTLERKIGIITAHTGIISKIQMDMTLREHSILFEEVSGEVEYTTTRPVAVFTGHDNEISHWIYRKKENKMDKYITSLDDYTKKFGGNQVIQSSNSQLGDFYDMQFNNFNRK